MDERYVPWQYNGASSARTNFRGMTMVFRYSSHQNEE